MSICTWLDYLFLSKGILHTVRRVYGDVRVISPRRKSVVLTIAVPHTECKLGVNFAIRSCAWYHT